MTFFPLHDELAAATSLLDLARRLGAHSLREAQDLRNAMLDPAARSEIDFFERLVAAIDPAAFGAPAAVGGFASLLDEHQLRPQVARLETWHPLEHLAFLRGLCHRALPDLYRRTEARIRLEFGMPIPFARRDVTQLFSGAITPPAETGTRSHLLDRLSFTLFHHAQQEVGVALDYAHRDRLDELTWTGRDRLPTIATLHPCLAADHVDYSVDHERACFFNVRPAEFDLQETLEQLRRVGHADVAVLPELCLPQADALEDALNADGANGAYPPLVVAGSAHVRGVHGGNGHEIRANESRIYLDGRLVASHRKCHPLETRTLGDTRLAQRIKEDITDEAKEIVVLSGDCTRPAVVICADLNDVLIPGLLKNAGVNLLLVPSFTYGPGAFNETASGLAAGCQGVTVVVNAELEPFTLGDGTRQTPFLLLIGLPLAEPEQQTRTYRDASARRPSRAIVDPNLGLDYAVSWVSASDGVPDGVLRS